MTLDGLVMQAVTTGQIVFEDGRFAKVYDLWLVRPVVSGERWSLITGADQIPLRRWTHLCIEIARAYQTLHRKGMGE